MSDNYDAWSREQLVDYLKQVESYNAELKHSLATGNTIFLN